MFKKDSLELRILEIVRDHYPITKEDLTQLALEQFGRHAIGVQMPITTANDG